MPKNPEEWTKSSFTDGVQCVEVRRSGDKVELRDDTDYDAVTEMSAGSFDAFRQGVKAGEFDHI